MIPKGSSIQRTALWLRCIGLMLLTVSALRICQWIPQPANLLSCTDPNPAPDMSQFAEISGDRPELTFPSVPATDPKPTDQPETAHNTEDNRPVNILLIGTDRWGAETQARSDCILLCTIDKEAAKMTMTSFLRDLYVPIPGHRDNRLNAAYAAGGAELLCETLTHNFGILPDGWIEVDFSRFPQLINLLGGVTLELRADEAKAINESIPGSLTEGTQLLNGDQALAYTRIRKLDSDGDFSRTNRHRKLLEALLKSYENVKLTKMLPLLKEATTLITTDMNMQTLLTYALEWIPMLPDLQIQTQHIPEEGTYSYQTIRGMAVLVADLDSARVLLEKTVNQ